MGESGTAPASLMVCTRCGRQGAEPLAVDGDKQRFQCRPCGESFWGPLLGQAPAAPAPARPEGVAHAPIAAPEPGDIAEPVLASCGKCGKPYSRLGKFYERHLASCDGSVKYEAPAPRRAAAAPAPDPLRTMDGATMRAIATSIEALRAQRSALEGEIRGINSAIETLEKIHGPGGAGVPFGGGA